MSKNITISEESAIRIRVGNRVIGNVRGDTFFKILSGSRHFKTQPAGIAFDVSSLNDAMSAGASWVNVTDRETGRVYSATIAMIEDKGIYFNQGYGDQLNLLFQYWTASLEIKSRALKPGEAKFKPADKPAQLSLWGQR